MDDEKTLRIEVAYNAGQSPSQPPNPPSVPSPPSIPNPPSGGGSGPPIQPPQLPIQPPPPTTTPIGLTPTVGIPTSPPLPPPPAPPTPPVPPANPSPGANALPILGSATTAMGGFITAVGAATAGIGAIVTVSTLVNAEFNRLVNQLGDLNAEVSKERAIADQRRFIADVRQAQDLAGPMSAQINRQTNLDLTLQRIETNLILFFEPMLKRLGEITQTLASIAEFITNPNLSSVKVIAAEILKWVIDDIAAGLPISIPFLENLITKLERYIDKELHKEDNIDASVFQKEILDALDPHRPDLMQSIERGEGNKDFRDKPRPRQFH